MESLWVIKLEFTFQIPLEMVYISKSVIYDPWESAILLFFLSDTGCLLN